MAVNNNVSLVGIGASAGGLSVLKKLVSNLPQEGNIAYIIVQHLDPTHESMLTELLEKVSSLPIEVAADGVKVVSGNIYVIPPNTYLEVEAGKLKLTPPQEVRGMRKAVDHLFRSLARECEHRCIGIVLSGAGNDGTAGLRMIKAAGGLTIAQDPKTAEHASMPESAINAGVADKILKVEMICSSLKEYLSHPYLIEKSKDISLGLDDSLQDIAHILVSHEGFDIQQYKSSTIQRRIARRMGLAGIKDYEDYLSQVRQDATERKFLIKDLLINVTDFFRDGDAFEVVENDVLPDVIKSLEADEDFRVWVAGCATGEEVYSLTILLIEAMRAQGKDNRIKVFATDIDEEAIAVARKGIYSESIVSEVPDIYIDRYFIRMNRDVYQIQRQVRDLVSFAVQNVTSDPPFSQMHIISCRNLLIYLKKEIQNEVINAFHFALKPEGYLFLGSAESIGAGNDKYKVLSKKWRIYKKENSTVEPVFFQKRLASRGRLMEKKKSTDKRPESITRAEQLRRDLLGTLLPPTMIVGTKGEILYNHGNLSPYVIVPEGEPHNDLFRTLIPALTSRVRSVIFKARKSQEAVSFTYIPPEFQDRKIAVKVEAQLLLNKNSSVDDAICITFFNSEFKQDDSNQAHELDQDKAVQQIEQELVETKEELQNTIEELETSTEELKASHEEALSTNEELQSANEELEASTEELRSLNEELRTVNEQLKEKIDQMQSLNDDLNNFFGSTNIPTIFLDTSLKIQRYTPATETLLGIGQMDIDRPIHALNNSLLGDDLMDEAKSVLHTLESSSSEKIGNDRRWFKRGISPYKTEDRRIEGVVVTFLDITEMKRLAEAAHRRELQQSTAAKLGMLALSGMHIDDFMDNLVRQVAHTLNVEYCKILKYQPKENNLLLVSGIGWRPGLVGKVTVPDQQDSQAGFTLTQKEPVIVPSMTDERRFYGPNLLFEHDVVSGMSVVINHSSPPYGVLGIHSRSHHNFDRDDANFIQSIANLLSIAVKSHEANAALKESESKLRIAKDSSHSGSFEYYLDKELTVWDPIISELWGLTETEKPCQELFWRGLHPDDKDRIEEEIKKASSKSGDGQYSAVYRVINNISKNISWVQATGKVIFDNDRAVKMIGMVQDITSMKQSEESLKLANDELRSINARQNEFVATLGHELRNPLAAISGAVDLIQDSLGEKTDVLHLMDRNVHRMSSMLDDLLDLARIARGRVRLDTKLVDLKQLLGNVVYEFNPIFTAKNQALSISLCSEEVLVEGDVFRLEQVIGNLLTNASKFTQTGGDVNIIVNTANKEVKIQIIDNGVGIDGDPERIFLPFSQITPDKNNKGLGIGLALVKSFVEMHGGTITVESAGLGKGCAFAITFELVEKGKVRKSLDKEKSPDYTLKKGLKVMIVDDNEDAVQLLELRLKKNNCEVSKVYNAAQALALLDNSDPEVFLLDIGLPDMDGSQLLQEIKKTYKNPALFIAHTGYGHEEAKEGTKKAGFDHHITKPLKITKLLEILSSVK